MDIEGIERATLAAVPPQRQETWQGWLLAFDDGTVGRCHSAAPLQHTPPTLGTLEHIASRYARAGFTPVLRVPEIPEFHAFAQQLLSSGYQRSKPTSVLTAPVPVASAAQGIRVELASAPAPGWEDVFLGEGFDPVDGASRLAILRRGRDSVFATVRSDDRVVAVGSACMRGSWCGVHGMRTLPEFRGRGHASAILGEFARLARERGVAQWFLQVDNSNAPACRLYERLGFVAAWTYAYWRPA